MLDWNDLKYLARLSEAGSLSGAARLLKVEHATVARRIAALERSIGARLVDRRGGRYTLTAAGIEAVAAAQRMEVSAFEVERIGLGAAHLAPVEFSVTAPPAIATELIVPRLPAFLARHRDVALRLIAQSRNLSLTRGEADVALRLSRPDTPTLAIRRAGVLTYGLFGSKHYLAGHAPRELAVIALEQDMAALPQQVWLDRLLAMQPVAFRSNDLALHCAAAKAGMGVAALPVFLAEAHGLEPLWPHETTHRDVWLTYHQDLKSSPLLGLVAGFLVDCLPGSHTSGQ